MWNPLPYQWPRVRSKHFCARPLLFLLLFPVAYLVIGNTAPVNAKQSSVAPASQPLNQFSASNLPAKIHGQNLKQCLTKLNAQGAGWCEIYRSRQHPSISSVWPKKLDKKTKMRTGPASILIAWNGAAFDEENRVLYFFGGGHKDYGGNEVYRFKLDSGEWTRLTDPSPLDYLYVVANYNARPDKPWRMLCWIPDIDKIPASTHTYDGFIFSHKTKTLFLYAQGIANGSCFEDKNDTYKNTPGITSSGYRALGWYEFNPSPNSQNNGLAPLSWRKVFNSDQLEKFNIHKGYPASVEFQDGKIAFGSKYRTAIYDPTNPIMSSIKPFTYQADWGDGTKIYDHQRKVIWSLHKDTLLSFNAINGRSILKIKANVDHGKSLAIDNRGRILSWNGKSKIYSLAFDKKPPYWKEFNWGENGPQPGDNRVYGKWVYLPKDDVFVGLSSHKTGVWVYKHSGQW